ncbi:EamA family transporter [Salinisphaera sp. RV14]|uniref:EamA family transporter n=1 Tax=Salinisphaera sp. RV14 TaxID=3454140 RepID=UPI003F875ADB
MSSSRHTGLASLFVLLAGSLWGLYWVPVRALASAGLVGARGSLLVAGVAFVLLLMAMCVVRSHPGRIDPLGLGANAAGGAAFMLYSVGLVEGRISAVILLFYLTPVWTTLITALVLRWPVPRLRYAVIGLGLIGLVLVLGVHDGVPLPHAVGEWLGLAAGALWSLASVGMRVRGEMPPLAGSTVFAAGALIAGGLLWLVLPMAPGAPAISLDAASVVWAVAAALIWWIGSMLALVWAAARLEPARVGILLMSEVLVGVVSSALFAHEALNASQIAGAALLLAAGLLDALSG